ncbi:MAG: DcaP family trimeric outer membrane transporter [Opitutales bacterium]
MTLHDWFTSGCTATAILLTTALFQPLQADEAATNAEIAAALKAISSRLDAVENRLERPTETSATEAALRSEVAELRAQLAALSQTVEAQTATLDRVCEVTYIEGGSKGVPYLPDQKPKEQRLEFVTSKYRLCLYGYIKLDGSYDTQMVKNGNLAFFVLPDTGGADDEFNLTANQTRMGLKVDTPARGGDVHGRLEVDFYGGGGENKPNPRLRLAFAEYKRKNWSLLAGQDWDTLITIFPRSVNFSYFGFQGRLGYRRPQLRYTRKSELGEGLFTSKFAIGRTVGGDIDGFGTDDGADAGFPHLQWNFIYERPVFNLENTKAKVSVSGHYGQEEVDRSLASGELNFNTWSVVGSFFVPFTEKLALQGSVWTGTNLDDFYAGIGQGINGTLGTEIAAWGGWAQLLYAPAPDWKLSFGGGIDDPDDDDLNIDDRTFNYLGVANVFWTGLDPLELAFEYSYLETGYKGQDDAVSHRLQGAVIFKF